MPKAAPPPTQSLPRTMPVARVEVYSPAARAFHWLTVLALAVQAPLGLYMVSYAKRTEFAAPSGTMYDAHKLMGLGILLLVVARLGYRMAHGAPADEPTIEPWQKLASHLTHWGLYALLLAVPLLGWLATSYYGAMQPFGLPLPSLVAKDEATSEVVFVVHKWAAIAMMAMAAAHVGAALFHHLIRKDNVLRRMIGRPR